MMVASSTQFKDPFYSGWHGPSLLPFVSMMLDGRRRRSRRHTNCVIGWVLLLFSLGRTAVEAKSGNDSHQRWLAASSTVSSSPLILDNFPGERTTTSRRIRGAVIKSGNNDNDPKSKNSASLNLKTRKRLASSIAIERISSIKRGGSSSSSSAGSSSDVKYSAAASAAIQSLTSSKNTKSNSRRSSSSSSSSTPYIPTNLLSESALMDRETNAIYWQGGETDIFSTSVSQPYLAERGIKHIRATVLTTLLWLWIWGILSRCITEKLGKDGFSSLSFFSPSNVGLENQHVIIRSISSIILPIARFILLLLYSLLYLRLPQYSPKVIATTIILYLIESYSCSTRRYLSHSMNAPTEVEAYLERIRNIEPSVIWRVRCFHYEERGVWKSIKGLYKLLDGGWKLATTITSRKKKKKSSSLLLSNPLVGWKKRKSSKSSSATATTTKESSSSSSSSAVMFVDPPTTLSWMAKKVVTHEAVGTYKFGNWADYTLASTWKRAQSSHSNGVVDSAPFSKVTLSKLLVLKDKATREDYFAQQAAFVMMEGRRDVRAEFATSIDVEGFRSKLLAVRPVLLHHRAASTTTTTTSSSLSKKQLFSAANIFFRQHIYLVFTLLGLSLPYRIWFARHCDEIRVTVVKETCIEDSRSSTTTTSETSDKSIDKSSSSWFLPTTWGFGWGSSSVTDSVRAQELFRKSMSALSLYGSSSPPSDEEATTTTTTMTRTEIVGTHESDWNETMIDESSTTIVSSLPESSVARTDSIPNLSTEEQPSIDIYPISPPTN